MAAAWAWWSSCSHGLGGGSGSSRNTRFSCTRALLFGGYWRLVRCRRETVQESVHDGACLQQLCEYAEGDGVRRDLYLVGVCGACVLPGHEVGPSGGDQRSAAVRKNDEQTNTVMTPYPLHHAEGPPRERVTLPGDRHLARKVAAMGSVSLVPSTGSTTTSSSTASGNGSGTPASSG
jgi:hypothetical protein